MWEAEIHRIVVLDQIALPTTTTKKKLSIVRPPVIQDIEVSMK
jgi:hypothetical protein